MMRSFEVVTTCSAAGWEKYGRNCVRTFLQHWPEEIGITVYTEGFNVEAQPRVKSYDLTRIKWLHDFKQRHRDNPNHIGMAYAQYDFTKDGIRFAHKIAAYTHAFMQPGCRDVGIWMDADCLTHSEVRLPWLDNLLPYDAVLAWLDRAYQYPECGFLMFDINTCQRLLMDLLYAYEHDQIFKMQEWHDSYVLQQLVHQHIRDQGIRVGSLSTDAGRHVGHPLINGPLGACFDHLKGTQRKDAGRSFKKDLRVARNEQYWRAQ